MAEPIDKLSIGYETLVSCRVTVVSEIAGDPGAMASSLFQHRFISEETKDKVSELNETKKKKARLLVDDIESKVKSFPGRYEEFLTILSNTVRFADLVKMLGDKYKSFQDDNTPTPLKPSEPVNSTDKKDTSQTTGISGPPAVLKPQDSLQVENPPYNADVEKDSGVTVTSGRALVTDDNSFKELLLQTFQSGESTAAINLLSQPKSKTVGLRNVRDSNGKTLLHLACHNNSLEWFRIIVHLITVYECSVLEIDKNGNTLLHEAYQYENYEVLERLLSMPSYNPDVFNKHGFTVLRMALQKNDVPVTRALLATGRVDPRRGSPDGLSYEELIARDDMLPKNIEDSAVQMVAKCAECIQKSSIFDPNFEHTLCYLLDILDSDFKNHIHISIPEIVEHVKRKKLPVPENAKEIHNLLIKLLAKRGMCGESANDYGKFQVLEKVSLDEVQQPGVRRSARREPVSYDLPDETPAYHSDAIRLLPVLQQPSKTEEGKKISNTMIGCAYVTCISCYCFWLFAFLILGICGATLYDGYSLVGTTSAAQIHRQSVPLIGVLNGAVSVRLTEIGGTEIVLIKFYVLPYCSSNDSFQSLAINETTTVGFDSPTDKSKSLTEWYFFDNTTLATTITTDVLPNNYTDDCIAFLVAFNNFNNFINFLTTSF